jgi:glycosyltransferase involved in cell wall biosynthesis
MIHDLAPLHFPDEGTLPPWLDEVTERAALLLTPSRFTADDLKASLGVRAERLHVIGGGPALEARAAQPLEAHELDGLGIAPPFALRIGGYTKRKNVPLLLDAWSRVPSGTLVLCGPRQPARDEALAAAPSLERVVVLDYVSSDLLARLLRSAATLVSTSTYEGFGLPPLEAMSAGTPVVAVRAPFVEEVCGDAAYLVPGDADAVAGALLDALGDGEPARRLRTAGTGRAVELTWERAAESLLAAYSAAFA